MPYALKTEAASHQSPLIHPGAAGLASPSPRNRRPPRWASTSSNHGIWNHCKTGRLWFLLDVSNQSRNRSFILAGWQDHTLTRNHPTTLPILITYFCAEDRADKSQGQVDLNVGDRACEVYWRDLPRTCFLGSPYGVSWWSGSKTLPAKVKNSPLKPFTRSFWKYQWHSAGCRKIIGCRATSSSTSLTSLSISQAGCCRLEQDFFNSVRANGWKTQSWHLRMRDPDKILETIY